ncbi:MAG: molybdopterin-dependent oxidoreductase [Verrucomicrobiales bacterium]|nr:molybdopterin-dependent oxidoreductase [Verrucomicrobiales bacterium]
MSKPKEKLQSPLEMAFVVSPFESARICSIDFEEAAQMDGVHAVLTAADVIGKNNAMYGLGDMSLFAEGEATFIGHLVAVVVAERASLAQGAADLVRVDYKPKPPVLEIEEALKLSSFHSDPKKLLHERSVGHGPDELEEIDRTFVFPDHVCLQELGSVEANVTDSGGISVSIDASCDSLVLTNSIASLIGLEEEQVRITCEREIKWADGRLSQIFICAGLASLCSFKTGKLVRFRPSNAPKEMLSARSGQVQARVHLSHDSSGKIKSIDCRVNVDSGSAAGIGDSLRESLMSHFGQVHSCPRVSVSCSLCKTNRPPSLIGNREGAALGAFISEGLIAEISSRTDRSIHSLRKINFSHFMDDENQDDDLRACNEAIQGAWDKLLEDSSYRERQDGVVQFNESTSHYKRGIAAVPVKVDEVAEIGDEDDPVSVEGLETFFFGAAVAEVQVDSLTGEVFIIRVDALQLSSDELSPALQVSEMSASFLDGLRNYFFLGAGETAQELSNSLLLGSRAVPEDLRFDLMDHGGKSVRFSSSVSYCLSMSVYEAVRKALSQYRKSLSLVDLPLILTPESVYNAIHDRDS